jgi:hypothetical protein
MSEVKPDELLEILDKYLSIHESLKTIVPDDDSTNATEYLMHLLSMCKSRIASDRAEIDRLREAGELAVVLFESIVRAPDEITDRTVANIRYVVSKFSTAGGKDEKE